MGGGGGGGGEREHYGLEQFTNIMKNRIEKKNVRFQALAGVLAGNFLLGALLGLDLALDLASASIQGNHN